MSKKRALLTSAVLSMAVLAASCGGGGGGAAPTTGPSTGGGGGGGGGGGQQQPQPTVDSPAVFAKLASQSGAFEYRIVDYQGDSAKVSGLDGQDIVEVLYQFNNGNLIVRSSNDILFCVNVQSSTPTATNLNLAFNADVYTNNTQRLTPRGFYLVDTTVGGYVITNNCQAVQVHTTGTNLVQITNTYAIVRDNNNEVFVVRSNGSTSTLFTVSAPGNLETDDGGASGYYLVGDSGAAKDVYLVDNNGMVTKLSGNTPYQLPADAVRDTVIQATAGGVIVAHRNTTGSNADLRAYVVMGNSVINTVTTIGLTTATNGSCAVSEVYRIELDANGNLYVAVRASTGTCFTNVTPTDSTGVVGVYTISGAGNFNPARGRGLGSTGGVNFLFGLDTGVIAFVGSAGTAFYLTPTSDSNITNNSCTDNGSVLSAGTVSSVVSRYSAAVAANTRVKNRRGTGALLIGMINGGANNIIASLSPTSCVANGEATDAARDAFANVNESVQGAFVIDRGGQLRHYTVNAIQTKGNVNNGHFAVDNCGAFGDLAQPYTIGTIRACVPSALGGFTYRVVDYVNDSATSKSGPSGIQVLFGDASNNSSTSTLFSALARSTTSVQVNRFDELYIIDSGSNKVTAPSGYLFVPMQSRANNVFRLPIVK